MELRQLITKQEYDALQKLKRGLNSGKKAKSNTKDDARYTRKKENERRGKLGAANDGRIASKQRKRRPTNNQETKGRAR